MGTPAATLDDLVERLARLERKLDAALRPSPKLLSKRAAAKMLGVDRGTKLERWIRDGALRLVDGKIPLPDVERLVTNGPPEPKARALRQESAPLDEPDKIRDLDV